MVLKRRLPTHSRNSNALLAKITSSGSSLLCSTNPFDPKRLVVSHARIIPKSVSIKLHLASPSCTRIAQQFLSANTSLSIDLLFDILTLAS